MNYNNKKPVKTKSKQINKQINKQKKPSTYHEKSGLGKTINCTARMFKIKS